MHDITIQNISLEICSGDHLKTTERSDLSFVDIYLDDAISSDEIGVFPWLETVGPYEMTIFNEFQVKYFISDLKKLKIIISDEKKKKLIDDIIIFATKVIDEGPHTYLKLMGD